MLKGWVFLLRLSDEEEDDDEGNGRIQQQRTAKGGVAQLRYGSRIEFQIKTSMRFLQTVLQQKRRTSEKEVLCLSN